MNTNVRSMRRLFGKRSRVMKRAGSLTENSPAAFRNGSQGRYRFLILTVVFGLMVLPAWAQSPTTWTGLSSTDWAEAGNWSAGVPTTTSDAVIPSSVPQAPVIGTGTAAVAKSVEVQSGASLTIANGGSLTINGYKVKTRTVPSITFYSVSFYNEGTVENGGQVILGNTGQAGGYGIVNLATFNNNEGGSIQVDQTTVYSLFNEAGTFTNSATITIGSQHTVGTYGIYNKAKFNNAKGTIQLSRSSGYALFNEEGTFTNSATITIGAQSVTSYGINNKATFTNQEGASIQIARVSGYGLFNEGGTFSNSATITIGSQYEAGDQYAVGGLYNSATFNNVKGSIEIDRSTTYGLFNEGGTFTNAATITIGTQVGAGFGINNKATFTNQEGASIQIAQASGYGLFNEMGTFTNSATITIGASASVGAYGLYNKATFNNAKGSIEIDRSTGYGLFNEEGTFTNEATITIGANAAVGNFGLANNSTFNNTGGVIQIDHSALYGLLHTKGTFTNSATITIGTKAPVGTWGLSSTDQFNNSACRGLIISHYPIFGGLFNYGSIIEKSSGTSMATNYGWIQNLEGGEFLTSESGILTTAPGVIWTGCTSTDWTTATNWIGGFVPTATDDVVILATANQPTIGANTAVVVQSIEVQSGATLTIASSATLTVNGSKNVAGTSHAFINAGNVANSGRLVIENTPTVSLANGGTLTNHPCAELQLATLLANTGSLTNSGLLRFRTHQDHANSGSLTNNGIIEYPGNWQLSNVTNNDLILASFSVCQSGSTALQSGTNNRFQIGTTWYQDQALTQSAGTFDPATNTFTVTNLNPGTTQPLYFAVVDPVNSCTRTVSVPVTANLFPVLTITTTPSLTVSSGTSVTLAVSGGSSYTWSTGETTSHIIVSPTSTTVYSVSASNGLCTSTKSETITTFKPASASLSGSTTLCPGQPATLSVALAGTAPWSLIYTDGITPVSLTGITTSPHTFTVNPTETTTYSLLSVATSDMPVGGTVSGTALITRPSVAPAPTLTLASQSVIQNTPFLTLTISGCPNGLNWTGSNATSGTGTSIPVLTAAIGTSFYSATCVSACPSPPASTTITVTAPTASGSFDGFVYGADCSTFRGWAWDRNKPNTPFSIEILDGPSVIGILMADQFRQDLLDAGKGNGKHAFFFTIPERLKDGKAHFLTARVADSNFLLKDSPKSLICVGTGTPENKPPVPPTPTILVSPLTAQVGVPFSGTLVAFADPEGQPLTYKLTGLPAGLSINETTRVINGTATEAGTFVLAYSATEATGSSPLTNSVSFPLTVTPALSTTITGDFEGYLDKLDCGGIRGWVWDRKKPNMPITVEFYLDGSGTVLGSTVANIYRQDLKDASKGNGAHAYNFSPSGSVTNGTLLRARVLGSTYELKGGARAYQCASPARLSAETGQALQVTLLGNPVSDQVRVEIRGAEGHPLQLYLTDGNGRLLRQEYIGVVQAVERQSLAVGQQPAGLYLLRVSSGLKSVTLKVLKQ